MFQCNKFFPDHTYDQLFQNSVPKIPSVGANCSLTDLHLFSSCVLGIGQKRISKIGRNTFG